jgi:hypothetical protein
MARPVRTGRSRQSRRGQSEIRGASIAKWARAGRCLTNRADKARRGGRSKKADEAVKGRKAEAGTSLTEVVVRISSNASLVLRTDWSS